MQREFCIIIRTRLYPDYTRTHAHKYSFVEVRRLAAAASSESCTVKAAQPCFTYLGILLLTGLPTEKLIYSYLSAHKCANAGSWAVH